MTARAEGQSVHDFQHELIAERLAAYKALPRHGNGAVQYRRREAGKAAWWALTGHLAQFHRDVPRRFVGWVYADVAAVHDGAHRVG